MVAIISMSVSSMAESESKQNVSGSLSEIACPYNELYIYYFKGRLKTDYRLLGSNFLGNWEEEGFSFLFFNTASFDKVEKLLTTESGLVFLDKYHMTYDEWHGGAVKPFKAGGFDVFPPWDCSNNNAGESVIVLDPGVVFGTGTHTTTHDCLEAISQLCYEENVNTVLDLGTGTGLLALAAVQSGCTNALAIDFNFLAANTAGHNIRLNRLNDKILAINGRAEDFIHFPADLVIANIHYDVMKHLINSEEFLNKKWFVLSGLLRDQARDIEFKIAEYPTEIINKWERDGIWHTFLGKIC